MNTIRLMIGGIGLVAWLVSGCGSNREECLPTTDTVCQDGVIYLLDSCGEVVEEVSQCPCGCADDQSGCRSCDDCPAGKTDCHGECVDTTSDPDHCGGCDQACDPGEVCENSSCEAGPDCRTEACPGGYYCNINTGECLPGCASDSHCGENAHCDIATHECTCNTGYHDCSGTCRPDDSIDSCGDRCVPCPSDPHGDVSCQDAQRCWTDCHMGYHFCTDHCVPDTSVDSCGDRCDPCPADPHGQAACEAGACFIHCDAGYLFCQGACAPCPAGDPAHFSCRGSACIVGYQVGVNVSGLSGTVVIENNQSDVLTVSSNGNFAFSQALEDGEQYDVAIRTQPELQVCTLGAGASGIISGSDVLGIPATCIDGDAYEPDDEPAWNVGEALEVDADPQQHNLHTASDVDWIVFSVPDVTHRYAVRLTSCSTDITAWFYTPDSRNVDQVAFMRHSDFSLYELECSPSQDGQQELILPSTQIVYLRVSSDSTGSYQIELDDLGPVTGTELTIYITYYEFESEGVECGVSINFRIVNNSTEPFDGWVEVGTEVKNYGSGFWPDSEYPFHVTLDGGATFDDYLYDVVSEPYIGLAYAYVDYDHTYDEVDETNNLSPAKTWCSYTGSDGICGN